MIFRLLIVLLFTPVAQAGLFAEPYVGYSLANNKAEVLSTSPLTGFTSSSVGTEFGVRLGAKVGWFWLALDPTYYSGSDKQTVSNTGASTTPTRTQTGIWGDIGFDLSSGFRIWGGASVYNSTRVADVGRDQSFSGSAWKIGLGYRFFYRVGLNFEYKSEKPTKLNDSIAGDIDVKTHFSKMESSRGLLSLSFLF